jgi:hypothetical protein
LENAMTATCYTPAEASGFKPPLDILRGAGLAVSIGIILVLPAIMAVLAFIRA